MDKTVHHTLCKLKVLSKIESGQNLLVNDVNFKIVDCQRNNWERFLKWWLGEDRYATANKLQSFYLELKELITSLLNDTRMNETNLERLYKELQASMDGLDNLMKTYDKDHTIISQLETLKENFQLELDRLGEEVNDTPTNNKPRSTNSFFG